MLLLYREARQTFVTATTLRKTATLLGGVR